MSETNEAKELQSILKRPAAPGKKTLRESSKQEVTENNEDGSSRTLVQWTSANGKLYIPAEKSIRNLQPGLYEIKSSPHIAVFFQQVEVSTIGLVRFPDSNSSKIIQEIETFWEREALFAKYGVTFKRGILLWGPPGGGKTCTIKMAITDLIKRNGVVVKFNNPGLTLSGLRIIREIQPTTPVIVLMEDLDAIIESYNESEVVNILDGVDSLNKIIFIATTNYPEKLGERIVNRPSRFDRKIKIGMPSEVARTVFLKKLFELEEKKPNINKWVEDTDGMSIAHIKELFISVVILGSKYDEAIELLRSMSQKVKSTLDGRMAGFNE